MQAEPHLKNPASARGKLWTLVSCTLLFVGVFAATYRYVFPRFGQEPVSPTSSLKLHESLAEFRDDSLKVELPTGETRFLEPAPLLEASHFSAFRSNHNSSPPEVVLLLSESGRTAMRATAQDSDVTELVVMLNEKPVAPVRLPLQDDDRILLKLNGASDADVNEVFARLTE